MPLSAPVDRDDLHTRTVECRGYRRRDGLWDIEAHLVDTKTYVFLNKWRGPVPPGDPVHDMWVRMTVDDDLVVRAIEAVTDASPFRICGQAGAAMQTLVGLRIAAGWTKAIKSRLGGAAGCTHLVEMMGPLATAAVQTIGPVLYRERGLANERPPMKVDSCYALGAEREVIAEHWPEFARKPAGPA